jgi:hypothetical protein
VILNARDRVVVEYLPRLSDQIGQASVAVHRTLENAPAHVDAVAQKLVDSGVVHGVQAQAQTAKGHAKKAGKNIKAAATDVSKTANAKLAKQQKPKHRGLLIFGIIAAAVAAGVAAWKASRPVEDPWKVPTPVTPAPAAPASETLKDAADKAGSAAVAAADSAVEASAQASDSVAAAADKASEAAKDAADDTAKTAAKVATDAKTAVRNIASNLNNGANKPGQ